MAKLTKTPEEVIKDRLTTYIIRGIVILFIVIVFFQIFYTINAGNRGVLLTFGKASMVAKSEGLNMKLPFFQRSSKTQHDRGESDQRAFRGKHLPSRSP